MTRRPKNHVIGDKAQTRVRKCFEDEGFVVNDLPRDYGEDLLVRIFRGHSATPYAFLVQSKGGGRSRKSRPTTSEAGERGYRLPLSQRHLTLWRKFALPVVVTYWDERTDQIYWQIVPVKPYIWPRPVRSRTPEPCSIWIPASNILGKIGVNDIRVAVIEHHALKENMALCIEALLEIISEKTSLRHIECEPQGPLIKYNEGTTIDSEVWRFLGSLGELFQALAREAGYTTAPDVSAYIKTAILEYPRLRKLSATVRANPKLLAHPAFRRLSESERKRAMTNEEEIAMSRRRTKRSSAQSRRRDRK